jgi:RND family efflux transporter MFP subunit
VMLQEPQVSDIVGRVADGAAPPIKRRLTLAMLITVGVAALLGTGIYAGIRHRAEAEASLSVTTTAAAVPIVDVVNPQNDASDQELILPGQTMAFTDTPIYARTNGYLKRWYFDIGAHVRQGQLLAEIETPELDAQLRQARADLETAQANSRLAGITAQRTANLLKSQSVSTQERDNAAGAYTADQAIVSSRQAEVARLQELQSYENVYAPFDGEITARNTDVGDLINAGAGTPTTELFHMTATRTLRIFVAVPEEVFHGSLVRTNGAIDPAARTLLVEVDVDNAAGRLLPGAYAFVHFMLPGRSQSVTVPANVLLFRSEGLRVGVVRDGKAKLVPIVIGRDYGDRVEVLSGLQANDQIILNPSDSLLDGANVRLAGSKPGRTT